jgi:predicted dehydrogenase
VLGRCDTNLHSIEVEDTASAILRHAPTTGSGGGAHGHLHVSTAEAPPISRTLLTCDRGRIEVHDGRLLVTTLDRSLREAAADEALSSRLDGRTRELSVSRLGSIPAQLDAYYANLAAAIDGTEPLAVPGIEGLASVELANAIALSSARGAAVQLPLDREAFQSWMDSKLAGSQRRTEAEVARS